MILDSWRRRLTAGLAVLAGLGGLSTEAWSQEAPVPKLIKLVVPFSPGASNDLFARALAQRLAPLLNTAIIVENKPGAGGSIGAEFVSRAEPDGSVLLFSSNSFTTNAALTPKLPYDMNKSFAPVALMARSSMIFVVASNSPYTSVAKFVAAARDPKSRLSYGSSGVGGLNHISTELFHSMAGTQAVHIPYKGISGAVLDLIAGNIQLLITTPASVGEQVKAGLVKAVAVGSTDRSKFYPELPTIAQTVPGYRAEGWWGVFAPGGTPKATVERLNLAIRSVNDQPEIRKLLAQEGAEPGTYTASEFAAYYFDEIAKWKKLVAERNLSSN